MSTCQGWWETLGLLDLETHLIVMLPLRGHKIMTDEKEVIEQKQEMKDEDLIGMIWGMTTETGS